MNSRAAGSPRKTTRSPVGGVPRVLHPDVVLVGEEVRQARVGSLRAEHLRAGRGPCAARCPSARRAAGRAGVKVVGDVAGGEDPGGARLAGARRRARRCRPPARPPRRARRAARRRCPRRRRRSRSSRPSCVRTRSTGAVALDRGDAALPRASRRRGRGGGRGRSRRPRARARAPAATASGAITVTSTPRCRAEAATSQPIQPAPITTSRPPASRRARSASLSPSVRRMVDAVELGARDAQPPRLRAGGQQQAVVAEPLAALQRELTLPRVEADDRPRRLAARSSCSA